MLRQIAVFSASRRVIAGDGHGADLGGGASGRIGVHAFAHDGDAPRLQRVVRQRRDVSASDEHDRAAVLEHAGVGFGDHLKPFHGRRYVTLAFDACSTANGLQPLAASFHADDIQHRIATANWRRRSTATIPTACTSCACSRARSCSSPISRAR